MKRQQNTLLAALIFILLPGLGFAQVAWTEPANATVDSTVTLYFDATQGDQGLMDYQEDVYVHTGVITLESTHDGDWKHVVSGWGVPDETVLMTQEADNLYSLQFHIRDYYGIGEDETVRKLAFVFRNADGSVTARSAESGDIFIPLQNQADWQYLYFTNTTEGLKVNTTGGLLHFQPYADAVRTEILPEGSASPQSYGVVASPAAEPFDMDTTAGALKASHEGFQLLIQKSPLQVDYLRDGDTLTSLTSFLPAPAGGLMTFRLGTGAQITGGGSRALPVNLHGHAIDFYNQAHYGYGGQANNLNVSIPVLASSRGFAWLFDNHAFSSADIGAAQPDELQYQASGGTLRFFITAADNRPALSGVLAHLTGHAPMPPRWALGYIQSRYGYQDQDEAETIVHDMRAGGFPLDALVLDLYWFGGTQHMGDFNWHSPDFPQPVQMMESFSDQGVETILITEPYFTLQSDLYDEAASLGHFATNEAGNPFVLYGFWAGDASLLDMTSPGARQWLWPHYQALFDMGVSGLWTDLGEPETHPGEMQHELGSAQEVHNIYNNLWAKMLYDNTREHYPQKRLFNLTRSGYTGMQRYGTYPWSGDIQRSFSGLQQQIPIMVHTAASGLGYMHSDLGGFTGGGQDAELYTRWLQLGTFSPIMRAHGHGVPPEPIFYDNQTQEYVRKAIAMRYDFLPYNYTLAWQYAAKGLPLVRPMDYYNPEDETLAGINDQFFWGDDVLVAPVLGQGASSRLVVLPEGRWAAYGSGQMHHGGQAISVDAPLGEIPVFLREGGFVVQARGHLPHTKMYDSDSIRIRHALPADGAETSALWYHDDGMTAGNIANQQYNLMEMTASRTGEVANLRLEQKEAHIASTGRQIEWMVYGLEDAPGEISLNGSPVELYSYPSGYNNATTGAYWDGGFLYVHFPWKGTAAVLRMDGSVPASVAENLAPARQVLVSPNPLRPTSQVEVAVAKAGLYRLTLYAADGRRLAGKQMRWQPGKHKLPLSVLLPFGQMDEGLYILQVTNGETNQSIRMIKR